MSNRLFWEQKINLGGGLIVPRFMAAPLDGVTDSPLRRLIRDFSPEELLMTEMRHVGCVANQKDGKSLQYDISEHPLAFQVSANHETFIPETTEKVVAAGFKMLNLNCGCPARCVIKSGSGSALMADLERLKMLIRCFHKALAGRIPFTIKIRAGFKERNAVDVAKLAEDEGVTCIMIHPRTQPEGFVSRLDNDLVKRVKEAVKIPIIYSGNINNFKRAEKTHEQTGVDGFMIGRALWGAPWKMREIIEEMRGNSFEISTSTAIAYALRHFMYTLDYYGSHGFNHFKKQLPQYIRSVQGAAELRKDLLLSKSKDEMESRLMGLFHEYCGSDKSIVPPQVSVSI